MIRVLRLTPIADIGQYLRDGELVAFNIGPDGAVYLLLAQLPVDYRTIGPGATFAKTQPETAQTYRLVALQDGKLILDVTIRGESFNIHHVQPLPDELLLACSRSHYRSANDVEKNGRIYSPSGEFQREILLGDGIQDLQTSSSGTIWTSYFDEGVFGNFGWDEPIGASGLVQWDVLGNRLYEFVPTHGLDAMCDCYALNVASDDDVWCYYYTQFPLVHIRHRNIIEFWQVGIAGGSAFALDRDMAIFCGGRKQRGVFSLIELRSNGMAANVATFRLHDNEGNPLVLDQVRGRADSLFILSGTQLYRLGIATAVAAI